METAYRHIIAPALPIVSEELSSVETVLHALLLPDTVSLVSEELSSVETAALERWGDNSVAFQKNLVVWKQRICAIFFAPPCSVSEELSSVETTNS